jgi:AraC family transcriptional activator of pobA
MSDVPLLLCDPRNGGAAFKFEALDPRVILKPRRFNYFTILWIQEGRGRFHADLSEFRFCGPTLLFFNPYQTLFLAPHTPLRGAALQFHANFFCIETYHEEVGCNGVLFNGVFGEPQVPLDPPAAAEFAELMARIEAEFRVAGLAHSELLVSYLKVLLIKATRIKLDRQIPSPAPSAAAKPPALARLPELIERNYQAKHNPSDYAALLNITPKALGKLAKTHFGKTLTELIRERVLKHAKWQLLHTRRPIKEIAAEVGFDDEFYFSRWFKRGTGTAPTSFREFETAIRGGRNLSM